MRRPAPLTDESPMPFGRWRGERMRDVPATHLLWLAEALDTDAEDRRRVLEYIADNRAALDSEVAAETDPEAWAP